MDKLKKALSEKTLVFGTQQTIKRLRNGKAKRVFISSNCPDKIKETIIYYSKFSKAEVIELTVSNEELGISCKKPFPISVLSY